MQQTTQMTKLVRAVKEFRERTGLGLLVAKNCVEEAGLDVEKAIEIARKREGTHPLYNTPKQATTLGNGLVASYISEDGTRGVMVELLCETDFAAKTDVFKQGANLIAHGRAIGASEDNVEKILNNLNIMLKEPVRLGRYVVFDLRD